MYVKELGISGVGGIGNLKLRFHPGLNLICGPNGIGKTTILECIGNSFLECASHILKRNSKYEVGKWNIIADINGELVEYKPQVKKFHPDVNNEYYGTQNPLTQEQKKVIVFKTYREIPYQFIEAVNRDAQKDYSALMQSIFDGIKQEEIKQWFINRLMFEHHPNVLSDEQHINLELAKKCFEIIDPSVKFSTVKSDTFDIVLNTLRGEVYFEYLSSGYKSILYILLGLIKEIEFRYKDPDILVEKFNGVVLIDELDLHLHPQWQAMLVKSLKKIFPNVQIIATTHSPNMVQAAEANEIIPLGFDHSGDVYLREIKQGEYGYQGWTLEEILENVMGLSTTRSDLYNYTIKEFEKGIDGDNYEKAYQAYCVLDKMLHPSNNLRKLLKLQLATVGDGEID